MTGMSLYGTMALRIQRSRQQAVQSHMRAYRNGYRFLDAGTEDLLRLRDLRPGHRHPKHLGLYVIRRGPLG